MTQASENEWLALSVLFWTSFQSIGLNSQHMHTLETKIGLYHKQFGRNQEWHSSSDQMFLGNDPLRIWLCAVTVSANALLSCYWVLQTLPCRLLALTLSLLLWYFMVSRSCYFASVTACCVVCGWCSHLKSLRALYIWQFMCIKRIEKKNA